MKESEIKRRPCAACGKRVGTATIVAGGPYDKWPDDALCIDCGTHGEPEETQERIRKRREASP
jgi:hypothetical protein